MKKEQRTFILSASLLREVLAHARTQMPLEAVGLLVGAGGRAERCVPLPNVAAAPETRFMAEPQALLAALKEADARGERLAALYHSHPKGPARPSPRDLKEARYGVPMLIVVPGPAVVRAFELAAGETAAGWLECDLLEYDLLVLRDAP